MSEKKFKRVGWFIKTQGFVVCYGRTRSEAIKEFDDGLNPKEGLG